MDCRVGKYKKKKNTLNFFFIKLVVKNEHFERIVKEKFDSIFAHATGGNEEFFSFSL